MVHRVLREAGAGFLLNHVLEDLNDLTQIFSSEVSIVRDAAFGLVGGPGVLEFFIRNAHNHGPEHFDQAAVAVIHKALIAGQFNHAAGGFIVQADVQHGVHHAGHAELGAGAAGDQQGIRWVSELLAGCLFNAGQGSQRLIPHVRRELLTILIGNACLSCDGEERRHRHANAGHLCQVGTFPT